MGLAVVSAQDREKWDARYAAGAYASRLHPTALVERWVPRVAPGGRALDLACGAGRNAIALARAGFEVDAVDISAVALERGRDRAGREGLEIRWRRHDLDDGPPPGGGYALIVVARFIARELAPWIVQALALEGHLLYEHHLQTRQAVGGPRSPGFRVGPNELLRLFGELRVLYYAEEIRSDPDGARMAIAELVACRGNGGL